MKEKYLINIKNAMFWHFTSSEIKDTLEELNAHFDSACSNGLSEREIINEYGTPEIVVKELRNELNPVGKLVIVKRILYIACTFAMFTIFSLFSLNVTLDILVILSPVLIWFLSGSNCIIGIFTKTKEKYHAFVKIQIVIFLLLSFLHLCSFIIVPYVINARYNRFLGQNAILFIYFIIVSLLFMTIFYLKKMLQGNLYMFFIIVQNISIIAGLFLYANFLKNLETTKNIHFIFTSYFLCLPVLLLYWIYIYRRGDKIGCPD